MVKYDRKLGGYMGSLIALFLPFIFMCGIMYLLLIRPQKKKEQNRINLVESLVKGDRIRTFGGIVGNIKAINERSFIVHSGASDIEILKEAVAAKVENTTLEN